MTFDLDLGVKVTRNVAQYPLHHVTYSPTKFEVATSNGLGGDTFTRNVTDGRTHGWTDRRTDGRRTDFDTKLIYPFFLKKKAGIIIKRLAITLMYCNRLHAWWSTQSRLATLLSSLIAHGWVRLQTLWWFWLKELSFDEMVGTWCFGCFFFGPTGIYLLDFFCSGIQFYLLLSPYLCFISLLYPYLYVLGDDALII